jgi:hypothetical protein
MRIHKLYWTTSFWEGKRDTCTSNKFLDELWIWRRKKGVPYLRGFSTAEEDSETHEFAVCTLDKSRIWKVVSRDTGKTTSVATRENQSSFSVPETELTHR